VTLDELESSWSTIAPPALPGGISGKRALGLPPERPVYLAVDSQRRRHLLVQIPDGTVPIMQRETRSLDVATSRFQVGTNPESLYVDLLCTDSAQHHTFSAIAQDIIRTVRQTPAPPRDSILNALARWRAFWMVKSGGMTHEAALGLFGELWFLRRWLAPVNAITIARWQATDAARHDFQWHSASVEVKTTAVQTAGPPTHRIASIEQLADPEEGDLYLFSLQICEDALSANTLHSLVGAITADLQADFHALSNFNDKLAARDYSPADQQNPARPFRILAERLYRVDATFPRLTRACFQPAGIPTGIAGIEYLIDLAACQSSLVATVPTDIAARALASAQ
jgi:hypothetical protein